MSPPSETPPASAPSAPGRATRTLLVAAALALALAAALPAATIPVTTPADVDLDDADCSLREAIVAANTDAAYHGCPAGEQSGDRIVFAVPLPATIALAASLPRITRTVSLDGPGANLLTVDGQDLWALVEFRPAPLGEWLGLRDLTLTGGRPASSGGSVYLAPGSRAVLQRLRAVGNRSPFAGGGVQVLGTAAQATEVAIVECEISGNVAEGAAGGGGVALTGPGLAARVEATTIAGNAAAHANAPGGGLAVQNAALALSRSTVSGNTATSSGGGLWLAATTTPASLELIDTTVTGNVADADGSGFQDGGGLAVGVAGAWTAAVRARNAIVAANDDLGTPFRPDVNVTLPAQVTWTSEGFNLIGSNEGAAATLPAGTPNAAHDWVGSATGPIAPLLDVLADYGGFAPTHRPLLDPASPVLDQGSCPAAAGDQRGGAGGLGGGRIADLPGVPDGAGCDGCDRGAVERLVVPGLAAPLFADGLETGHPLLWSAQVP